MTDDLTLHLENIMKIIGAEGTCLWKELQTSLSISKEQADTLEKRHGTILLQDLLQTWLEQPEASWKRLIDALNRGPEPGPRLAEIIVTKHTELAKEEAYERTSYGALQLCSNTKVLAFPTIKKKQMNVTAVVNVDLVETQIREKVQQVRERIQATNQEFIREVAEGANYWKSKRDEERMLNLSITTKLGEIITIVGELQGAFQMVKRHYTKLVFSERTLLFELNEVKKYFNEPYFKQLRVRIARLEHLGSPNTHLLSPVYEALQLLSSAVLTAEENHTKCSELTIDDRQYMAQLRMELKAADGALHRIRNNLVSYRDLKKEEIGKWGNIARLLTCTCALAGIALAPFTNGIALLATAGAATTIVVMEMYTNDARRAVQDYDSKMDKCAYHSQRIQSDLRDMERDLDITENKNLVIQHHFINV